MPRPNKIAKNKKDCCHAVGKQLAAGECLQKSTAIAQNGKRFEIQRKSNHKETVCKLDIDCWLPVTDDNQKKCDAMFIRCLGNEFYFVELKGSGVSDLKSVYKQITDTIDRIKMAGTVISLTEGYIIGARIPVKAGGDLRKFQRQFKRDYQGELFRKSQKHTKII